MDADDSPLPPPPAAMITMFEMSLPIVTLSQIHLCL